MQKVERAAASAQPISDPIINDDDGTPIVNDEDANDVLETDGEAQP